MRYQPRPLPSEVVIEVTSKCNFSCQGCFNLKSFASEGRTQSLSDEFIFKIIDSTANAKIPMVRFTGGEPLLRNGLINLVSYAKEKGLKTRINTNASFINSSNIELFQKFVDSVLVSFNGHNSETDYQWTNTKNSYESKLRGLGLLKNLTSVEIRLGTVLTHLNVLNLEKIYSEIKPYNVSHWEVYRPITSDQTEPIKEDLPLIITKLSKLSLDLGRIIPIVNAIPFCSYDKHVMSQFCKFIESDDGHARIIVDPRGFAKPSYYINENIGDPTDILSCWNHEFMVRMRNLEFAPNECRSCAYLTICKGGSRFKAKSVFGSYNKRDPLMPAGAPA